MRYQERIYIQNENRAVRNKDMLNVNMSSDFAIFKSPTFDISGATKIQCGPIACNLSGFSSEDILSAATYNCFTSQSMSGECFSSVTWTTKIYEDNTLSYSASYYTAIALTGDTPSDQAFFGSLTTGLNNLGYSYDFIDDVLTVQKKYGGAKDLEYDLCLTWGIKPTTFTCPAGFSATPANDACQQITISAATNNGIGSAIIGATPNTAWGMYGAIFYPSIQAGVTLPVVYTGNSGNLISASNQIITPDVILSSGNAFWENSLTLTTNGRLNNTGIAALSTQFAGFSKCIDIPFSGTYYVGIAADNRCKVSIDGIEYISLTGTVIDNFRKWSVFPFQLSSGKHIIEMTAQDDGSGGTGFGVEIYYPTGATPFATLTAATSTASTQANVIFTTKEFVGLNWLVGTTVGYSCTGGYTPDFCDPLNPVCTKIENTGITINSCSGVCPSDCTTICSDTFPNLTNTSNGVFIIDPDITTTIPLTFNFTGNTDVFTATSASFKYNIYKYNSDLGIFTVPPVYKSDTISYSAFSGTNILQQSIPITAVTFDNQYVVKGFYEFNALTDYSNRLGKKIDTSIYAQYGDYQLYNPQLDYYFVGITYAESPSFSDTALTSLTYSNDVTLQQQVIYVDDYLEFLTLNSTSPSSPDYGPDNATGSTYYRTGSIFVLQHAYAGDVFVTLNGLTLATDTDYTLSGQTLTMLGPIADGDIITIVYTRDGSNSTLISESVEVNTAIPSGSTNNQGNYKYYYNTTTSKYEVYTNNEPVPTANVMLILNGITLIKDIDYYQSTTNKKRIILNGTIMFGDIIAIIYYPSATIINGITETNTLIRWNIKTPPQDSNGRFILEYGTDPTFTTYGVNSIVPYVNGNTGYDTIFNLTGSVGTNVYYRVKNEKNYVTICGDKIGSTAYSETVRVIIQSNAINSY
jgi:hypothetical protein